MTQGSSSFSDPAVGDLRQVVRDPQLAPRLEHFFGSIVDELPHMIFVKDARELRFVLLNKAGEQLLGQPRAFFIGKTDHDLFPRAQADFFIAKDRAVLAAGRMLDIPEEPLDTPSGRRILHTKKIPLLDAQGRPQYLVGISEDITQHKSAQEALDKAHRDLEARVKQRTSELARTNDELQFEISERERVDHALQKKLREEQIIFDSVPAIIIYKDTENRIIRINQAGAKALNATPEQLEGASAYDLIPDDAPQYYQDDLEVIRTGQPKLGILQPLRTLTGERRWLRTDKIPYRDEDGSIIGVIVFAVDVTQQVRAERELRALNELLEQRVADRTAELKRSNEDLERFAYVASHDLQEPLRMVSSYLQLLEKRYGGSLDKAAGEFIGFAVDGAKRMQDLIGDLLAYSRLGTRGGDFMPIDSRTMFNVALDNLKVAIEESGARIVCDDLPTVRADPTQLIQLFQNLLANAIKFHGPNPPLIKVEARRLEAAWEFAVRDNGIGIEAQYFDRIFVIFQRLHGRGQYPGTGIGLALCKKIVQRHGGAIRVESEPGKGSTFYFTLPDVGAQVA